LAGEVRGSTAAQDGPPQQVERPLKIALCLHGVVGNLYLDKHNHQWREDVDYRIGLEHYQRHLFAPNGGDVDVFIHSWSTRYEEAIVRDYAPKAYAFQEQINFGHGTTNLNFLESRWYSTKASTADGNNTYTYDTRGRMVQAVSSLGTTTYQVNALGQRIRKTNTLGDTVYHYDTGGRLIAETTAAGVLKREYLYLRDIPLAVVVQP
jgi:YD repeat-containing protein